MQVTVTARGALAHRLPAGPRPVELSAEATAGELLTAMGLPTAGWVCVVNGTAVPHRQRLSEGDRVQVFAQSAGG